MPILTGITFDTTAEGARLYRRSTVQELSPFSPGSPPYTSYTSEWVCGFYPIAALTFANMMGLVDGDNALDGSLFSLGSDIDATSKAKLIDVWNTTHRPAILGPYTYMCGVVRTPFKTEQITAREAVYISSDAPGWNAGAVSTASFFRAGRVKFRTQPGKRMVVGLQEGPDPTDPQSRCFGLVTGFSSPLQYGYRGMGNNATPMLSITSGEYSGTDDVFVVEMLPRRVSISRSGATVNPVWSLDLAGTIYDKPGVWSLGAAIFDPGAWVEGIEVVPYSGAEMTMKPMQMVGGKTPYKAFAKLSMPAMTMSAGLYTRAAMSTPRMRMRGSDYNLTEGYLSMPAMQMNGQEGFGAAGAPYAMLRGPKLRMTAHGLTGTVGRASMALPPMRMRGSKGNIGEAQLTTASMRMFGYDLPADQGFLFTAGFGGAAASAVVELAVIINTAGGLAQTIAAAVLVPAAMDTGATLHDDLTLASVLAALMETEVSAGADVPTHDQTGEVWVVGLAEDHPTSTFENYDFNSFAVIGGRTYGVKGDGLYLLEGDTDNGAPIRASVSYGKQDFGTKTMKHMTRAYVGASSTGKLYLKIIADGKEYLYAARSSSPEMAQQRFDVGRGLQANYFTFELFNKDGGDFEVDSVSFFAAEFKRRI